MRRNQTSEFRYDLLVCTTDPTQEPPLDSLPLLLSRRSSFTSSLSLSLSRLFPFALVREAVRSLTKANFHRSFCRLARRDGFQGRDEAGGDTKRRGRCKERLTVEISNVARIGEREGLASYSPANFKYLRRHIFPTFYITSIKHANALSKLRSTPGTNAGIRHASSTRKKEL